jgi:hypothetical protein
MTRQPPARRRVVVPWLGLVSLVLVLGGAAYWWFFRRESPEEVAKSSVALADLGKRAANDFLSCVADDEPNVDLWSVSDGFVKDRIAKHYNGLADRMRDRCLPDLRKTQSALRKGAGVREPVATELEQYKAALAKLAEASDHFIQKAAARTDQEKAFHAIEKAAIDWEAAPLTADAAPFERLFACAVPKLSTMDNADKLFRFFADTCVHGDPFAFMSGIQRDCGAVLRGGAPAGQNAAQDPNMVRRFHEHPGFMKLLWGGCVKDTYKVWLAADGGDALRTSLMDLREPGTRLVAAALQAPGS